MKTKNGRKNSLQFTKNEDKESMEEQLFAKNEDKELKRRLNCVELCKKLKGFIISDGRVPIWGDNTCLLDLKEQKEGIIDWHRSLH